MSILYAVGVLEIDYLEFDAPDPHSLLLVLLIIIIGAVMCRHFTPFLDLSK